MTQTTVIISIDHICRVCADNDCDQFIPIFDHPGLELSLLSKINNHLPIKVEVSDSLPQQVCEKCMCKLNICHELVQTAKTADIKLRHLIFNSDIQQSVTEDVDNNLQQSNSIQFDQFQLSNQNLTDEKPFPLTSDNLTSEKTLEDVQFEISISDSIEVVKTIDGDQVQCGNDTSVIVVNTDHVFGITDSDGSNKLNNLIQNNEHYSLTTVYQSDINENSENVTQDIKDQQNEIPNPLLLKDEKQEVVVEITEEVKESEKKLSCSQCGKVCKSAIGLDVHVATHSNESPYLCDLCGKNFKHLNSLYCHKRTHLDDSLKKRYRCGICSNTFRSKFHLLEHTNTHNGITPYKCELCDKLFHKRIQLRQHRRTHISEQDKLVCSACGSRFSRRGNLQQHMKTFHAENRTYKCRICADQFPTLSQLLSHRSTHKQVDGKHQLSTIEKCFTCHICGKVLSKKKSLEVHLQSHSGENHCWCILCGKFLSSKASLRYHVKAYHQTERSYHCQFCGKGYMSHELQLIHERTHTGDKPYKCSICGKAFSGSNSLNQHMQKHSDIRNFQCMYCSKRFHRKATLTVHLRTHTGEKPFVCDTCGHRFNQKNDMLKHQKTHQPQLPPYKTQESGETSIDTILQEQQQQYTCETCNNVFSSKAELNKHKLLDNHVVTLPVEFNQQNNDASTSFTEIITDSSQDLLSLTNVNPYDNKT